MDKYRYIKASVVRKLVKSHGKRVSKAYLEALDRHILAKVVAGISVHNGGKKTLDSAVAAYTL
jgi:hypothetical protein